MRTLTLLSFAAMVAAGSAAVACESHDKAAAATTASAHQAGCCSGKKAAATTAATRARGAEAIPVSTGAVLASGGGHAGCPHAAKMQAAAAGNGETVLASGHGASGHGAGKDCPYAALKANAAHGCKVSAEALRTAPEVRATGKVVCARCELHKSDACASVFQARDGGEAFLRLCGEGLSTELLKLTRHGELEVTVHGRSLRDDDGNDVLCLEGFAIGTI